MHEQATAPVRAAIDIGSNTIHIVVARCLVDNLDILADEVEMVRIGESVNATGEISAQKQEAAITVVRRYKELAEKHHAQPILVIATEAIRKATNRREFLAAIAQQTGLQTLIVGGEVEAILTFYGATYEKKHEPGAPSRLAVMDLGGGSTELLIAKSNHIVWHTSFPVGSGWLHDRFLGSDPPTPDDISVARTFLQTYFQGLPIKELPDSFIVTGGSANSLLLLAQTALHFDVTSKRLTYKDLLRCEGLMRALPAAEISQRFQQPLARARILPAGAFIISQMMTRLQVPEITISPHGIREGALLAYQRYGVHWLERVNQAAAAALQQDRAGEQEQLEHAEQADETFAQTGQRLLAERVRKLLEWRDEVLKHEDIEAVHKMRVASRRLRATLDGFESCCKPGQFKKVYRRVRALADVLGAARDTDVMLQGLLEEAARVPSEERAGVEWLIERLKVYREQKQKELEDFFAGFHGHEFEQQVTTLVKKEALSNGKS